MVSPGGGGGCDYGEEVSFMDLFDGRLIFLGAVTAPAEVAGEPSYPRKVRDGAGRVLGWRFGGWRLEE